MQKIQRLMLVLGLLTPACAEPAEQCRPKDEVMTTDTTDCTTECDTETTTQGAGDECSLEDSSGGGTTDQMFGKCILGEEKCGPLPNKKCAHGLSYNSETQECCFIGTEWCSCTEGGACDPGGLRCELMSRTCQFPPGEEGATCKSDDDCDAPFSCEEETRTCDCRDARTGCGCTEGGNCDDQNAYCDKESWTCVESPENGLFVLGGAA